MSRVLLADATPIVRSAMRDLLEEMKHEVVGEAADVPAALALAREQAPDLVIIELALPGAGGLDLLRRLRARDKAMKLLVYSRLSRAHFEPLCFQIGANGFVAKSDDLGALRKAVSEVLAGRAHFDREHMQPGGGTELERLTPRELAVLQMLGEGHSNLQIAERLLISFKTVSTYKARLLEKLHVHSNVELADIARRNGLLPGGEVPPNLAQPEELKGELSMLRKLVDAAPTPMFIRDREGRLVFCNQQFLDFHRLTSDVAIGSTLSDNRWLSERARGRLPERFKEMVESPEPISFLSNLLVFGKPRTLYCWAMPYRDGDGKVLGVFGGMQDVTENESKLLELRDRAMYAETRLKQQISAWLETLDELCRLTEPQQTAALAEQALANLHERLQHLKRTSQPTDLRPELSPTPCDLPLLLERQLAARAQINVSITGAEGVWVWLDAERLGEWLDVALGAFRGGQRAALNVDLEMHAGDEGRLGARIVVGSSAAESLSAIDLLLCRKLAETLEGQFAQRVDGERLQVSLELDLPKARPPRQP